MYHLTKPEVAPWIKLEIFWLKTLEFNLRHACLLVYMYMNVYTRCGPLPSNNDKSKFVGIPYSRWKNSDGHSCWKGLPAITQCMYIKKIYICIDMSSNKAFQTWNQPVGPQCNDDTGPHFSTLPTSSTHPQASLVFATFIGHLFDITLHLWRQVFFSRSFWGYKRCPPHPPTEHKKRGGCVYISSNVHLFSSIFFDSIRGFETSWQRPSSNPEISKRTLQHAGDLCSILISRALKEAANTIRCHWNQIDLLFFKITLEVGGTTHQNASIVGLFSISITITFLTPFSNYIKFTAPPSIPPHLHRSWKKGPNLKRPQQNGWV